MRKCAFKVAAATRTEQHIAAEQDIRREIGKMVIEMAGDFHDVQYQAECIDPDLICFMQIMGNMRVAGMPPPIHRYAVYFAQFGYAADMIGMAVGAQNRIELQVVRIEEFQCGRRFAGIDQGGMPVVVDGPDVVVAQGGNGGNVEHGGGLGSGRC